ncbi:tRNA pseudouridine(55) synthase TruB [Thermodesulfovibrio yellowstonii]|uniref:tRNA pseudouridine(55) synthase TruB n=1 Tax=Thermodesulfovibrio yellowstonii TaxID=28262 RepID=UPI003C7E3828
MNAVVVLNKPKGFTSQDTVTKVKKILKVKKAGHAGTLDPMATGILIVCINEATKITPFLMELEKEYVFKAKFGISTDTYDAEGKIVRVVEDFKLEREQVESILEEFTGEIMQIPPMYSAVKVGGKPLHELARKGVEIERKPKKVIIHSIKIESFEPPFVTFRVVCSKGTYVRSLCHDIGEKLRIGAHIVELTRTRIGEFRVEESIELEELKSLISNNLDSSAFSFQPKKCIFSIDQALYFLPSVTMQDYIIPRFLNGNPVKIPSGIVPAGWVKVKDTRGKILGIGYGNGVIIKPERIIWEEV